MHQHNSIMLEISNLFGITEREEWKNKYFSFLFR